MPFPPMIFACCTFVRARNSTGHERGDAPGDDGRCAAELEARSRISSLARASSLLRRACCRLRVATSTSTWMKSQGPQKADRTVPGGSALKPPAQEFVDG